VVNQPDAKMDATQDTNLASATKATTPDAKMDANLVASQPDAMPDAKPPKQPVVASQPDAKSVEGGTIGGELVKTLEFHNSCFSHLGEPLKISWMVDDDGSFLGQAFELPADEYANLAKVYGELDFPAELVAADQYLAGEFEKDGTADISARRGRLHTYLNKQNRKAFAVRKAMQATIAGKPENHDNSCGFDGDRLMVANGFRAELLALVGNDAIKLDRTLAKIGSKISSKLRGEDIRRQVRAEFTRQVDYDDRDERKVRAIEQRGAPVAYQPKPTSTKPNYAPPSEDPENIAFLKSIGVKL